MKAIERVLQIMAQQDKELAEDAKIELHEIVHGAHYDEEYAKNAVKCLFSRDRDSNEYRGEHFTIEETNEALKPYFAIMGKDDTCWDAYVIVNAWWHDLHKNHPSDDRILLADAITWAFDDDDAPDGKVWRYMRAMKH